MSTLDPGSLPEQLREPLPESPSEALSDERDSSEALRQGIGQAQIGLRRDLEVIRQVMHGRPNYVLYDPVSFRSHMFTLDEYEVLTRIVASRTLAANFDALVADGVLKHNDQESFFSFVLELHAKGLMQLPISDADRLYERHVRNKEASRIRPLAALMYFKLPLFDPDRFLTRTVGWVRPSLPSARAPPLACAHRHRPLEVLGTLRRDGGRGQSAPDDEQRPAALRRTGRPQVLARVWPRVCLQELWRRGARDGRGFHPDGALRLRGRFGELAIRPNLAARRRGLAGMYVESFIGASCLLLWAATPPGLVHALALNVVLLSTVMTLFFNLNPLMRYDGYYIASDLLGIPNLRERSSRRLAEWARWFFVGIPREAAQSSRGERLIYASYGVGSFLYKILLAFTITWLVVMRWPAAGFLLGIAFAWMMIARPLARLFVWLWRSEAVGTPSSTRSPARSRRGLDRPIALLSLPVSWSVRAPAVLESEREHVIRASEPGFVRLEGLEDGRIVAKGQMLLVLEQQHIELEIERTRQQSIAAQRRMELYETEDLVTAQQHREQLEYLQERLQQLEERQSRLLIRAPERGQVIAKDASHSHGRYVARGEELLRLASGACVVHTLVPESQAHRAHLRVGTPTRFRLSSNPDHSYEAVVVELRPLASRHELPRSLSVHAGGEIFFVLDETGAAREHRALSARDPRAHRPRGHGAARRDGQRADPAELETLGAWLHRHLLSLYHTWKMT
jgi:putative peptide zinc metalloprotease protein